MTKLKVRASTWVRFLAESEQKTQLVFTASLLDVQCT